MARPGFFLTRNTGDRDKRKSDRVSFPSAASLRWSSSRGLWLFFLGTGEHVVANFFPALSVLQQQVSKLLAVKIPARKKRVFCPYSSIIFNFCNDAGISLIQKTLQWLVSDSNILSKCLAGTFSKEKQSNKLDNHVVCPKHCLLATQGVATISIWKCL